MVSQATKQISISYPPILHFTTCLSSYNIVDVIGELPPLRHIPPQTGYVYQSLA